MKPVFLPDPAVSVLVLGDIILDRYVHGETSRISPEAPVPVVLVKQTEERPGGAANVALNISQLGLATRLVGLTGTDPAALVLQQRLEQAAVECSFLQQDGFPTITKLRVISQHQQLLRLDYESPAGDTDVNGLLELFRQSLNGVRIVVLSDYAKGSLQQVQAYISACCQQDIPVLVDPKGSDFSQYNGASLLTPNLKEFETVAGRCDDQSTLVARGRALCAELKLQALLVTQGEHGMTLIPASSEAVHLETAAREVFDVTGAGDTVIATMAAAMASGYDMTESAMLANRAAGLVVAKLGAASVTVEELNRDADSSRQAFDTVLQSDELTVLVKTIRDRGETIVMTNGCFDILHAGHVAYLHEARQLGDHLLVAVNDDASVRHLKGEGRPINPLAQRMAVLAALKPVDRVVAFSGDTPEALITQVCPDVLVKGGDYKPEQIAGADFVRQHGGMVKIIPLLEGCSTTRLINAMQTNQVQ